MPKTNHRRKNRPPVDRRYASADYRNGYARSEEDEAQVRTGRSGFLDKSLHGWGAVAPQSGRVIAAEIGNDFSVGHRGMAKAVRGAKKYVRSRTRFHENAATRREAFGLPQDAD